MYFLSTLLLPYTHLISTANPHSPGFGNMEGMVPNDSNSLETCPSLPMYGERLGGAADEQAVRPAGGGSSIDPIFIPGAEDMDEETVEELRDFFKQAGADNKSLDAWQRAAFLRREDVHGLAMALPALLTEDQRNWIIGRPPPCIVRDAIRAEFGLDSEAEVYKRVEEDLDSLNERQFKLILQNFHPINDDEFDNTGGSLFASLSNRASQTDGVVRAASNNLLARDGMASAIRKVGNVHYSRERRQARRQRNLQRLRENEALSLEESQARSRASDEERRVWLAGTAAREEKRAEWARWEEAASRLSDSQIAEMRRLRELGPEAVQQSFLASEGVLEGGIESGENSEMNA